MNSSTTSPRASCGSFVANEPQVDEDWGWAQLTEKEFNDFIMHEALASHVGKFIHKDMPLDRLRKELSTIKTLEWIEVEVGKKTPLTVNVHHTQDDLLKLHNEFAALHRGFEAKVNFYKAKIKNLVTNQNAKIASENAKGQEKVNTANNKLRQAYNSAFSTWHDDKLAAKQQFETKRQKEISRIATLRITVDPLFKETIDGFLAQLESSEEAEKETK